MSCLITRLLSLVLAPPVAQSARGLLVEVARAADVLLEVLLVAVTVVVAIAVAARHASDPAVPVAEHAAAQAAAEEGGGLAAGAGQNCKMTVLHTCLTQVLG